MLKYRTSVVLCILMTFFHRAKSFVTPFKALAKKSSVLMSTVVSANSATKAEVELLREAVSKFITDPLVTIIIFYY